MDTFYPNKFDKDHAVVAEEKKCPNCGGEYAADKQGCCVHCGTFLYVDNSHWTIWK